MQFFKLLPISNHMKPWWLFIVLLGATVHGTIYDLSLDEQPNAIVSINTSPLQRIVAKNASYAFTVQTGAYKLIADFEDYVAVENIIIDTNGTYILDLILSPDLDEVALPPSQNWIPFVIILSILTMLGILTSKKKRKHDLKPLIKYLKEQQGRCTQVELVKKFAVSEAKMSLMLTELESQGKIKKIKKGRGNIIILQ